MRKDFSSINWFTFIFSTFNLFTIVTPVRKEQSANEHRKDKTAAPDILANLPSTVFFFISIVL
jgi:hypothetical protein